MPGVPDAIVILQNLLAITGDDVALLQESIVLFQGEAAAQLEAIRDTVANADADALEQASHKLKSSSGHIGAQCKARYVPIWGLWVGPGEPPGPVIS